LYYNFCSKMWIVKSGTQPMKQAFLMSKRGEKGKSKLARNPLLSASTKTAIMAATLFLLLVFLSEKSLFS
jgi:hypothetical protein